METHEPLVGPREAVRERVAAIKPPFSDVTTHQYRREQRRNNTYNQYSTEALDRTQTEVNQYRCHQQGGYVGIKNGRKCAGETGADCLVERQSVAGFFTYPFINNYVRIHSCRQCQYDTRDTRECQYCTHGSQCAEDEEHVGKQCHHAYPAALAVVCHHEEAQEGY